MPGSSCVFAQYSFAVYALATQATGATARVVAARDYGHDLDAMRAAIDATTRIVFIANPNNPTGTFLSGDAIDRFVGSVPGDVVVVLDEAYNEYLSPGQAYDAMAMVRKYPNLVVSRSFSKAYGLAGLRVGYGIAQPDLTDLINRIRQPFNVNTLAQAAAAASLFDAAFLKDTYDTNVEGLRQLESGLRALGLQWVPSSGNFLLVEVGPKAATLNTELLRRGVIVRPVGNYGLHSHLRVSVGTATENAAFLRVLPEAMRAAGC
jgi:histidinol-phosphate aminotransferase